MNVSFNQQSVTLPVSIAAFINKGVTLRAVSVSGLIVGLLFSTFSFAQSWQDTLGQFRQLYAEELGSTSACGQSKPHEYKICSGVLRNEGNAPYILHHGDKQANVVVLIHGLSDSPYFMRAIASELYVKGFNVVVPLLPGHGLKQADNDMEDDQLAERWQAHIARVMKLAPALGNKIFTGGFSTGGALTVDYYLSHPDSLSGILLFSGALALSDNAESMSRFWGIKWVAKIVDGSYETDGPNPYKYPSVAGFAGLELMDIIDSIRARLEEGKTVSVPVFAAHSAADETTPIKGVRSLLEQAEGENTFFVIDERFDLCHADLVVSAKLLSDMHFDKSRADKNDKCAIPKDNPLYRQMVMMLSAFLDANT